MRMKALGLSILLLSPLTNLQAATLKTATVAQPQWQTPPVFNYSNSELDNQHREVQVQIFADPNGKVLSANVVTSSGIADLDQKIRTAVMQAKFLPSPQPFQVTQNFELKLKQVQKWLVAPSLNYQKIDLQGQNRRLALELTPDSKGFIKSVQILESTGLKHLDEKIIGQVKNARLAPQATPASIQQNFLLTSLHANREAQKVNLNDHTTASDQSKIWQFFPQLRYTAADLEQENRQLAVELVFNETGHVKTLHITQSSGLVKLDQKLLSQLKAAMIYPQHAPITLALPLILQLPAKQKP